MIATDKEKVKKVIEEISNAMTRIDAEREFIKDAVKDASEKYEIDKKILRKLARTYHKQNFNEEVATAEEFTDLYETIVVNK